MEIQTIFLNPAVLTCSIYLVYAGNDDWPRFLEDYSIEKSLYIILANPIALGTLYGHVPRFTDLNKYVLDVA